MNPYIKSMVLTPEGQKRCSGKQTLDFTPGVNILVGPNGSGKSTILSLCKKPLSTLIERYAIWPDNNHQITTLSLDTEKDNPRLKDLRHLPDVFGYGMISQFLSHGQTMKPVLTRGLKEAIQSASAGKTITFLIDEPEAALDFNGIEEFKQNLVKVLESNKCQAIIASHSPQIWFTQGANIVELVPGYMKETFSKYQKLFEKIS